MLNEKGKAGLLLQGLFGAALGLAAANALADGFDSDDAFIPRTINSSTIPVNGDVNPYGVAFVPDGFAPGGTITAGDVLVSNFNNGANQQGTGTTIIQLHPEGPLAPPGMATTFFSSSLPGLSTALGVLRAGFVIVGNVPTTDGTSATIGTGALQLIDRHGHWLATWSDPQLLDGPWDLAVDDHGSWAHVFVANVLNGSVTRLTLSISNQKVTVQSRVRIAGRADQDGRVGGRHALFLQLRELHSRVVRAAIVSPGNALLVEGFTDGTERTVEQKPVPMAYELGLGVTPWSPLKSGVLSGN